MEWLRVLRVFVLLACLVSLPCSSVCLEFGGCKQRHLLIMRQTLDKLASLWSGFVTCEMCIYSYTGDGCKD